MELQAEVTGAYAQLAAYEQELRVVHEQAVSAARRSMEAVRAAYTTGNASLLEWVDTSRSVLELEMEETALTADLALAVAALEQRFGNVWPEITGALATLPMADKLGIVRNEVVLETEERQIAIRFDLEAD